MVQWNKKIIIIIFILYRNKRQENNISVLLKVYTICMHFTEGVSNLKFATF